MKRCIELAKNCVEYEPYERPTIADIVHKLNEIETTIQKVPQVVNEPRNDPSSSLHQVRWFKATVNDSLLFMLDIHLNLSSPYSTLFSEAIYLEFVVEVNSQ